jgi:hypothetical protein
MIEAARFLTCLAWSETPDGDLVATTSGGAVKLHKPVVYQEAEGGRSWWRVVFAVDGGRTVGFRLGTYDRRKPPGNRSCAGVLHIPGLERRGCCECHRDRCVRQRIRCRRHAIPGFPGNHRRAAGSTERRFHRRIRFREQAQPTRYGTVLLRGVLIPKISVSLSLFSHALRAYWIRGLFALEPYRSKPLRQPRWQRVQD